MSNTCSAYFSFEGKTVACTRRAAPKHLVGGNAETCLKCWDAYGMENDHQDGHHEDGEGIDCPMCGTYDPRPRKGHTNGVSHVRTSHAECDHPRTPAGRAACRKARKA